MYFQLWQVMEANPGMPAVSSIGLHLALLNFVLEVHSDRLDFVDHVLVRVDPLIFPNL